jgi:Mn-dependent DtxR family transcriptional regulator
MGVQRTSVSLTAHALQKAGLIEYARGRITIRHRAGIRNAPANATR